MTDLADSIFKREIGALERAWSDGRSPTTLAAAVKLCHRFQSPLPAWAAAGVEQFLATGKFSRGRGATGNTQAFDRENRKHYLRWDAVTELRDRWEDIADRSDGSFSLEKAYPKASEILAGTEAEGDEDAVRKSYRLVQKLFNSGKGARFYIG